ncbi:MAG: hypothetical protein KGL62_03935 [Bradyrhizobium sp.]|uniref:hypothetical protein n=1 Tax=Bradyrhizobium sp. TaxID=376 RepID=UPI0023A6A898|nr:hypothetical protein [Bradyrhizobium sp.]MDE2601503.1 hypothetical protein [Bradyrhizobium sp.]
MILRSSQPSAFSGKHVASAGLAMLVLMIATAPASSQMPPTQPEAQAPLPQAPAPQPAPEGTATAQPTQNETAPPDGGPAREANPGLINEIGKMFGKLPTLKSPGEAIDDFNERAKDAAKGATDTLSRLTTPLMVTGRVVCPVSANGAPDCKTASDKLCQTKGFKEGKSLLTDSAETCSAKVLIPGRTRKPGDCRTDTYVTRALCQ